MSIDPNAFHPELKGWLERGQVHAGPELWTTTSFLRNLAELSSSCAGFQRRLAEHLMNVRASLKDSLHPEERERLTQLIHFVRQSFRNPTERVEAMGLSIEHVMDTSLKWACAIQTGKEKESVTGNDLRLFLQAVYDEAGNGVRARRRLIAILEEADWDRYPLAPKLAERIRLRNATAFRHHLTKYGVMLRPAEAVYKERDNQAVGTAARRRRSERLARMSPHKLEEHWIEWMMGRNGAKYSGRRKDVMEARGHHPYFTSIHHANYARYLTHIKGVNWIYRPKAFCIRVPEGTTGTPFKFLDFQPHFYLPDTDTYVVIMTERRNTGVGGRKERMARVEAISKISGMPIQVIPEKQVARFMLKSSDMEFMETLPTPKGKYRWGSGQMRPGNNISSQPDQFFMETDECPCGVCAINRKNTRINERPPGKAPESSRFIQRSSKPDSSEYRIHAPETASVAETAQLPLFTGQTTES